METEHMNVKLDLSSEDDKTDSDVARRVVGTTKGGKQIVIAPNNTGRLAAKFTTGGEMPRILKGTFTRYELALYAVQSYLASEPDIIPVQKKETSKNAKSRTKSKSSQLQQGKDLGLKSSEPSAGGVEDSPEC